MRYSLTTDHTTHEMKRYSVLNIALVFFTGLTAASRLTANMVRRLQKRQISKI